jgi:hypothetical protein
MVLKRVMGKASFATLQDSTGRMQVYVKGEEIGVDVYEDFKHWDLGDIVGAEGHVFKTNTGELSVHVSNIRMLTKSLRPLPDKFHGINDQEIKYRQRYIDLITDDTSRQRFMARSKAVSSIREFMVQHDFLEVETPMLHPIPGGANALISAILATPFEGRFAVYGSKGWVEVRDRTHPEHPTGWDVTTTLRGQGKQTQFMPPHPTVLANLEAFGRAVRKIEPYPVTTGEMLANVASVEAIMTSVSAGTWQRVATAD